MLNDLGVIYAVFHSFLSAGCLWPPAAPPFVCIKKPATKMAGILNRLDFMWLERVYNPDNAILLEKRASFWKQFDFVPIIIRFDLTPVYFANLFAFGDFTRPQIMAERAIFV